MRIWSLHPKCLDTKGIVALWRETLLAKNVLEGKTKGYKNHPQLDRFKKSADPVASINYYLSFVYLEAVNRKYNFDKTKFKPGSIPILLNVTSGQIDYEVKHLLNKLKVRDNGKYLELANQTKILTHPMFEIVAGEIENWEIF